VHKLISSYKFNNKNTNLILVDVGAHHGSFSVEFAGKGWKVIAFEPEKKNYELLKNQFKNFPNVTCLDKAVYNSSKLSIPFYTSNKHFGIHALKPFHESHELSYNVQTIRLDDALNELKIDNVSILKIDIEGADFLALKSFDFNRYNPEIVIIEFMDSRSLHNFGYSHHDVVTYMKKWNYIAYVSEWEPIREYRVEGKKSTHKWIQCVPYPLDHEPAWGNLFFVPYDSEEKFKNSLKTNLNKIKREKRIRTLKKGFKKLLPEKIINILISIQRLK